MCLIIYFFVADDGLVDDDAFVLAGFVVSALWVPPAQQRWSNVPASVMTVSGCLTDQVETNQETHLTPWYGDLPSAIAAKDAQAATLGDVRVVGVHVGVAERDTLVAHIDGWFGNAEHPVPTNLAAGARPVGRERGFEVIGFEFGRMHTWWCFDLHQNAAADLGHDVDLTPLGLLASLDDARTIAATANANRDTPDGTPLDVTWFPLLITEC